MLLLVPFRSGGLDRAFPQGDGFHLNEKGAALLRRSSGLIFETSSQPTLSHRCETLLCRVEGVAEEWEK